MLSKTASHYFHLPRLVLLVALAPTLAACWPLADAPTATPQATQPAGVTRTPVAGEAPTATGEPMAPPPAGSGQVLNLAAGTDDPATLDPALAADSRSLFIVRQLFSGLVRFDNDLRVVPDLAASMPQISPDGLVYTFTLRSDVVWPDGTPVTSADVGYSLERATDAALVAPRPGSSLPAALYLAGIAGLSEKLAGSADTLAGVATPDTSTVVITLDAPQAYFLQKLTVGAGFVVDRRNVVAGGVQWFRQARGTGPFRLREWRSGELIVLEPNPKYYGGAAKLAEVNLWLGASAAGGLAQYEQGGLDVVDVPAVDVERALDPAGPLHLELKVVPDLSTTYLGFNTRLAPFDDEKVRQAFALALDKDKIARVMYQSRVLSAAGVIPPSMPGFAADKPALSFDVTRARQLLAESRYGSATALPRITIYTSGGELGPMLQQVYRANLGVEIEVRALEWTDFLAGLDRHEYQAFVLSWGADWPDASAFMEALFRSDGPQNQFGYANPGVDAALDQAARELDPQARAGLYAELEREVLASAPMVPLFHPVNYTLARPYIEGLALTPLGILSLRDAYIVKEQ